MAELITQGEATSVDVTPLRFDRFDRFARGDLLSSRYRYRVLAPDLIGGWPEPRCHRGLIDRRQPVQ